MNVGEKALENRAELHVLLLTSNDERGTRLLKAVEGSVPRRRLEIYGNIEGLTTRLRAPEGSAVVAILLVLTEEELCRIVGISRLLSDLRLILILPNRDDDTVALGHMLHPRFLSYVDTDFRDVGAVLSKMMSGMSHRSRIYIQGGANAGETRRSTSKSNGRYRKLHP